MHVRTIASVHKNKISINNFHKIENNEKIKRQDKNKFQNLPVKLKI